MSGRVYMTSASKPKVIVEAPFDGKIMTDVLRLLNLVAEVVPVKRYSDLNDIAVNGHGRNFRQEVIDRTQDSALCWGVVDRDNDRVPVHDRVVKTDAWDMECSMFFRGLDELVGRVLTQLCVAAFGSDGRSATVRTNFLPFYKNVVRALDYSFKCQVLTMDQWRVFYHIADEESLAASLNAAMTVAQIIGAIESRLNVTIDKRDLPRYTLRLERVNGHILVNALALAIVSDSGIHPWLAPANVVRNVVNFPEVHDMYHNVNDILIQSADILVGANFVAELSRKISS
jgi:hypothetical protein